MIVRLVNQVQLAVQMAQGFGEGSLESGLRRILVRGRENTQQRFEGWQLRALRVGRLLAKRRQGQAQLSRRLKAGHQ